MDLFRNDISFSGDNVFDMVVNDDFGQWNPFDCFITEDICLKKKQIVVNAYVVS